MADQQAAIEAMMEAIEDLAGSERPSPAIMDRVRETLRAVAGDEELQDELRRRPGDAGPRGRRLRRGNPRRRVATRQASAATRPERCRARREAERSVRRATRALEAAAKRVEEAGKRLYRAEQALDAAREAHDEAERERAEREAELMTARGELEDLE